MEYFNKLARIAYPTKVGDLEQIEAIDILWYLWCKELSPLFGKDRITTFESYFIEDKMAYKEPKNFYSTLRDKEEATAQKIIKEFEVDPERVHIVMAYTCKDNEGRKF